MPLKITSLKINLPFGLGGATIAVTEAQRNVAWALYVELATRVAGIKLEPGMGSAREALNSIYSLFETTRSVLREQGPGAANGSESVGPIVINILNNGLRPFLVKWHTNLSDFETKQREQTGGKIIDESRWSDRGTFYKELEDNRLEMLQYIQTLASISGITHVADVKQSDKDYG